MSDKFIYILIGFSICSSIVVFYLGLLLYKKQTTVNDIENLKQKNKRNKGSSINNDIEARITSERGRKRTKTPKKGIKHGKPKRKILKDIFTK